MEAAIASVGLQVIYIFGSGGLALCAVDALLESGQKQITVVAQEAVSEASNELPYSIIQENQLQWEKVKRAFVAIGDNYKRHQLVEKLKAKIAGIQFVNCIHPSVVKGMGSHLGQGIYIGAQSVIGPNTKIGDFCILNCGSLIEHESILGDYINMGTGSVVGGAVQIGHRAILGVNTGVLHGVIIGDDALLASGACITNSVEPATVMMGVPAKIKKRRQFGDSFL